MLTMSKCYISRCAPH